MKYFSMFSGIGGFELGIHNAYRSQNKGIETDSQTNDEKRKRLVSKEGENINSSERPISECNNRSINKRPLCVGYSEIDKYAIATYESHFRGVKNYGNAKDINPEELPDFDLLVGGFPCQAFSIAGKRRGFKDTRGTLFFEIARIVKRKQPRMLVLENVKGLLNHDKGETFTTILKTLDELGYDAEWQVLNSKHFGVPQNRERVFIIGYLRGHSRQQIFPIRERCNKDTKQLNQPKHSYHRLYGQEGIAPCFRSANGNKAMKLLDKSKVRRLTPVECERLQGFPDNWTIGSDTQRYKQCGNAVTVNVIETIFNRICTKGGTRK